MRVIKLLLAVAALSGGLATTASAMPIAPLPSGTASNVEHVRWVCNPYGRCWWQPNYHYGGCGYGRGYGFYGPRRFYGGYGYRRGWGRRW